MTLTLLIWSVSTDEPDHFRTQLQIDKIMNVYLKQNQLISAQWLVKDTATFCVEFFANILGTRVKVRVRQQL